MTESRGERRRVRVVDQGAKVQPAVEPIDFEAESDAEGTPEETCDCPHLDREDWHEVESDWSDITFVQTHTKAVMGVPVGFANIRTDLRQKAEKAGATVLDDAMFLLGGGRFRRPVLLEVENAPEDSRNFERPGGFAYTELHSAPLGSLQKAVNQVDAAAAQRYGRKADNVWVWYLTCRVCSAPRDYETLFVAHYAERT